MTKDYNTKELELIRNKAINFIWNLSDQLAEEWLDDDTTGGTTEAESITIYRLIQTQLMEAADGISLCDVEDELMDAETEIEKEKHLDKLYEMKKSLSSAGFTKEDIAAFTKSI